jgi:transposase
LLRALLLQVLNTVRSERMLMEQLEYNLLFRWFVGLSMDEAVWVPTVFTKNRDRLWEGDIAVKFFQEVLTQAWVVNLLSDEHFSMDGTLIEASGFGCSKPVKSGLSTFPRSIWCLDGDGS